MTPELLAQIDQRVPRYTSYPTVPHFQPGGANRYGECCRLFPRDCRYRFMSMCPG